ncbi:MAG: SPOR domain-containing protein [Candidatus Aminicenantaceae bacterium]
MKNKDYREIQISSSQLGFVFVGIIILGIVIFLLGVSVGKKHVEIKTSSQVSKGEVEQIKSQTPAKVKEQKDSIKKELASHEKATDKERTTSESETKEEFFIQVGAFSNKENAMSLAKEYEKQGYSSLILEPFPSDNSPKFRVRLEGFQTEKQAEAVVNELMRKEKKKREAYLVISR